MICDGLKVAVKCSSKMKNSNATSDSVIGSRLLAVVVVVVESVVVATVVEVIVVIKGGGKMYVCSNEKSTAVVFWASINCSIKLSLVP